MRIWTYIRPFSYREEDYVVEVAAHMTRNVSRLWRGAELLDEQSVQHMDGIQTCVHALPAEAGEDTRVATRVSSPASAGSACTHVWIPSMCWTDCSSNSSAPRHNRETFRVI